MCNLASQKAQFGEVLENIVQLLKKRRDGLQGFGNEEMTKVIFAILSLIPIYQALICVVIVVRLHLYVMCAFITSGCSHYGVNN